jgi:Tol biopolymer transport system component
MSSTPARVPRRLVLGAMVVLALAVIPLLLTVLETLPRQVPPASGRIAWTARDGLWMLDLSDGRERRIVETSIAAGSGLTSVTFSPDGRRIAWSQQAASDGATGADIWVADVTGGNAERFAHRDAPTTMLEAPSWLASDYIYYTARRFPAGQESVRLERKRASGGAAEVILEAVTGASVTPDESAVVYPERRLPSGQALVYRRLDGQAGTCGLATDAAFPGVEQPRVSPDSARVAFAASAPTAVASGACAEPAAWAQLGVWLGLAPGVVWAHGAPADVWSVNLDGSDLRRVALLQEDEPTIAWSPDGDYLAAFGPAGLVVVPTAGGQPNRLRATGGEYGWVAWGR